MDRVMAHAEVQELLGAYALDALDVDEARQVERHLATCPECQAEVAAYREVTALIGYVGAVPPPGVWDRIAARLDDQPPPLRLDRLQTPVTSEPPRAYPVVGETAAVLVASGARSVSARVFAAVVALAAVVVIGLGIEVVHLNTRTNHLPNTVATQLMVKSYQAAASEFDARRVSLLLTNGSKAIPAVILPDGTAYVDARQLPRLAASRTYQLWGLGANTTAAVSLAVMGSDPVIQQVTVPSNVATLAVTLERAGGVPVSTASPLAVGQIVR